MIPVTVGVSLDAHLSPQWLIERVPLVRGGDTLLQQIGVLRRPQPLDHVEAELPQQLDRTIRALASGNTAQMDFAREFDGA